MIDPIIVGFNILNCNKKSNYSDLTIPCYDR